MKKKVIQTKKAPRAIGSYSQTIQAGNMLFLARQIPIDPMTGELAEGDIRQQVRRVLENIKARSTVEVAKLPRNADIEIEAIALI